MRGFASDAPMIFYSAHAYEAWALACGAPGDVARPDIDGLACGHRPYYGKPSGLIR